MTTETGLRVRKKEQTRRRIADAAAALFADRGYDAVSMTEVARAAEVSEQTVYNHFPAKQELVLDLADLIRGWYHDAVTGRGASTPAAAIAPLVEADIERHRASDPEVARGQFMAQSVASPVLRRFTLEERERQVRVVADAIVATTDGLPELLAHAHAASLIAVVHRVHHEIGADVLAGGPHDTAADGLLTSAREAFAALDRAFTALLPTSASVDPGDAIPPRGKGVPTHG